LPRSIPETFEPAVVEEIDRRLRHIETGENARILFAVESGSRAWGFASPDSDYDCRFLYVRPLAAYLSLFPRRDVIETPLDATYDVNGWDLQKTLRLLFKGNAIAIEWLTSPIVYRGDVQFRQEFLDLAARIVGRDDLRKHYYYQGRIMRERHLNDPRDVKLKAIFYALRPALVLVWLRQRPDAVIVPMNIGRLLDECELAGGLRAEIGHLLALKARSSEMGRGPMPAEIGRFVQLELYADPPPRTPADISGREVEIGLAEDFLRRHAEKAEARSPK
jgi:predicted nucleotidyltransferase